ncbi:MAG: hypothetical protein MJ188_09865 [Treponema sp.]|nr:hypothetical protein [Treponema sp.]
MLLIDELRVWPPYILKYEPIDEEGFKSRIIWKENTPDWIKKAKDLADHTQYEDLIKLAEANGTVIPK